MKRRKSRVLKQKVEAALSGPVEKAVLQLTKLVSVMVQRKKTSKGIEAILERSDGGGHEAGSSSSSASRSKAAAYQKLKSALTNKPEWLYQLIEDKLDCSFDLQLFRPLHVAGWNIEAGWVTSRLRSDSHGSLLECMIVCVKVIQNRLERDAL